MNADLSELVWRKSHRSSEQGGTCVELAAWRKSSYSNEQGGSCVELAGWRTSRLSNEEGGSCVEVRTAASERQVFVRDSKDPLGGVLGFGEGAWETFASQVRGGAYDL